MVDEIEDCSISHNERSSKVVMPTKVLLLKVFIVARDVLGGVRHVHTAAVALDTASAASGGRR